MPVNVNDVYQTVLFILNKEQRGYMTPPEFNKVGAQVQNQIFEKYFEDLNFFLRNRPTDNEYADRIKTTEEKITYFEVSNTLAGGNPFDLTTLPVGEELHRLGTVEFDNGVENSELQFVSHHELNLIKRSKLTAPTLIRPLYTLNGNTLTSYPDIPTLIFNYVKKPKDPIWAFDIGTQGQYEYVAPGNPSQYPASATGSVHFEISNIDKTELIIGILLYAGVIIRDPQIVQAASSAIQQEEVTEKS